MILDQDFGKRACRSFYRCFLLLLLLQPLSACLAKEAWLDVDRIVAMGDLHGDYE